MSTAALSIGDFSRGTFMSVKMLRHYHEIGLLQPAVVDPNTGYRSYTADQIPKAQIIRRFRELQMPLEQIREVLAAPDPASRNALIASHLDALQNSLTQTQSAVASLRNLLDGEPEDQAMPVTYKNVEATRAASITATVDIEDLGLWLSGALGELRASLTAQGIRIAGPAGGIWDDDLFANERGQGTVFIPCLGEPRPLGRVRFTVIPEAELATVTHHGSIEGLDLAYGALAAHVADRELGVNGPTREYYTVADTDTPDSSAWRTEIGLPIFSTGRPVVH
ncbi:MAG: transcriptional regulator, MerR family [Frondihabitans sp.]|nr:transcriptional regulator, MerR family [Frondihabitans sp.]